VDSARTQGAGYGHDHWPVSYSLVLLMMVIDHEYASWFS